MQPYQDKYGRFHDKPCINGEPSSNNGYIYTAYARKLGLGINRTQLNICFNQCLIDGKFVLRSPGKELPPVSFDEVIGAAELDLLKPEHLTGWSYSPKPIPKFNLFKLIKQVLEVRGKHRNYFWENNLDQIYRFAYSVPLKHRHFILQKQGKFNLIYWTIAKIDSLSSKRNGIRWLKYDKDLAGMQAEFPADHPFRLTTSPS